MLYDPQSWRRFRGLPKRSGFMWDGNRQMNATGGGPGNQALAHLDFVNGVYRYSSSSLTAAQVVDQPGRITGGSGLQILGGGFPTSVVNYLGNVATLLKAGNWSVVAKINTTVIQTAVQVVNLLDAIQNAQVNIGLKVAGPSAGFGSLFEFNGGAFQVEVDATNFISANVNKVGGTRTDTYRSVTQNGDPVDPGFGFDTTNDPIANFNGPIVQAAMTCFMSAGAKGFLQSLDIYSPVLTDAQLKTITTLP